MPRRKDQIKCPYCKSDNYTKHDKQKYGLAYINVYKCGNEQCRRLFLFTR